MKRRPGAVYIRKNHRQKQTLKAALKEYSINTPPISFSPVMLESHPITIRAATKKTMLAPKPINVKMPDMLSLANTGYVAWPMIFWISPSLSHLTV